MYGCKPECMGTACQAALRAFSRRCPPMNTNTASPAPHEPWPTSALWVVAQATIELEEGFQPTCMVHPDTYLNKVVVGGADGRLQLWNFASGQRLFEFRVARCAVRCLAPAAALDVVGAGLADG